MGLKDILNSHNVELPDDFDEREKLVIKCLRRDPDCDSALAEYKNKVGGGAKIPSALSSGNVKLPNIDSEDWLGPRIRNFLDLITSPAARGILKTLFMVIFFVSYLESIPVAGNLLSVALDVMIAGSKMMTKVIQTNIPPMFGLLPIPYASMVGLVVSAMFGAIVWPIIAMVSLSRQDFAASIESYLRVIPPPFGSTIADMFMEANRMVARIDLKRQKLASDIANALRIIVEVVSDINDQISSNFEKANSSMGNIGEKIESFSNKVQSAANVNVPSKDPSLNDDQINERAETRASNPEKY